MTIATPDELHTAPEVAILAILDQMLQQAIYALFSAHPELVDEIPFHLKQHQSAEIWLADTIYEQASTLQHTIAKYREAAENDQDIGCDRSPLKRGF